MSPVLLLVLSQAVNPYGGLTWKGPLPVLDAASARRVWLRVKAADAGAPAPRAPLSATDFRAAGPRTAAASLVGQARGMPPLQVAALVDGLNAGLDAFERESRRNNVACALAFLIGISQQVATDRPVTDAQTAELAQAVNDELAASAAFRKTGPRERQLLYETCIVVGALIGGLWAEATELKDDRLKARARELAAQALSAFSGA